MWLTLRYTRSNGTFPSLFLVKLKYEKLELRVKFWFHLHKWIYGIIPQEAHRGRSLEHCLWTISIEFLISQVWLESLWTQIDFNEVKGISPYKYLALNLACWFSCYCLKGVWVLWRKMSTPWHIRKWGTQKIHTLRWHTGTVRRAVRHIHQQVSERRYKN